ncbi:hypothetical protein TSUD_153610 [Trifolium subterraneum]|uniref:Major facilitator superfamily (MFS) profile domain-containing protein n=1 Tax=Trifolium subterraneum TaxID=3900 RepID=A0A2Z6MK93_TRISU|nr:hypothetical protein TSUD_153610 [Trifolium subterraneum]
MAWSSALLWPLFLPAVCGRRFVVMLFWICCFGAGVAGCVVVWSVGIVWSSGVAAELGVTLASARFAAAFHCRSYGWLWDKAGCCGFQQSFVVGVTVVRCYGYGGAA